MLRALCCLLLAASCLPVAAQPAPTLDDTKTALERALTAMAAQQRNGGWGRSVSADGAVLRGEHDLIREGWITLQPPATPTVAGVYLRAAKLLSGDPWEGVVIKAKDAIIALQTTNGGFPHEGDPAGEPRSSGTFDDDTTTACINFLLDWAQYAEKPGALDPVKLGPEFIFAAQTACGGWPQYFPAPKRGYQRYITLNDNVVRNVITTLLRLHREPVIPGALDSAKRGGECFIKLQGGEGEAIWAHQYDPDTLEPAWARNFEPPGYSPAESIGAMDALVELYLETGEDRFLEPLPKAFAWYDAQERLPNGKLARLYEPGTHRPLYGRRDKPEKVYDFEQATTGYGWQVEWYPHAAKAAYERIATVGRDAVLAERAEARAQKRSAAELAPKAAEAIAAINADGLWTVPTTEEEKKFLRDAGKDENVPMIPSGEFCQNAGRLLDYYEALLREQEDAS
jgi:PelA/Pel-15E family pectate lyase